MTSETLRDNVLNAIRRHRAQPMDAGGLATKLGLRGGERGRLHAVLQDLVRGGDIVRIRDRRYTVGSAADLVTGTIDVNRGGDGFVNGPQGACLAFVPRQQLGTALPGDRVVVRLDPVLSDRDPSRGPVGRVIEVLERGRTRLVGRLATTGKFLCVVPMDPRYPRDFYVPDARGAAPGDRVIIALSEWRDRQLNPEADIVEVIGPFEKASTDTVAVMRHYDLPERFPPRVLDEAARVAAVAAPAPDRADLRDRLIVTIDPASARDFDDALSLERLDAGARVLGVHIADVSHVVPRGSALDDEAAKRGNSVYLPDQVIPMLPEQLSNGLCSLRPDEDRLAFSVLLTFDGHGAVTAAHFTRSVIRSRRRLRYEEVLPLLEGAAGDIAGPVRTLLMDLHRLAQQLRRRRFARHALRLDTPDVKVSVDAEGQPTDIRVEHDDVSHQLVEECMLAANEAVARELSSAGLPLAYRVHLPPNPQRMADLTAELVSLGFQPGDLGKRRGLARFLDSIVDDPRADMVRLAVLKSLNRAEYSAEQAEHFGLAKTHYCHFTSPIRRYPDLLVHRQLTAHLQKSGRRRGAAPREAAYRQAEIEALCRHCSATERRATDAERMVIEIKKYRFLQAQLDRRDPEVYDAVAVNVTNFGLFVEVPALQVQGLVHVGALSERFVRYSREDRSLRFGRRRYAVGSRLRVRIAAVDMDKRRLDFVPED